VRTRTLVLVVALVVAACGDTGSDEELTIVATTTVLGDVVSSIAGPDVAVEVLLPIGADPHDYRPSARQVAAVRRADLVVAIGLGLEQGLGDVLDAARDSGVTVLEIGNAVQPLSLRGGEPDPHVWLDPVRMSAAVALIGSELSAIEPAIDWSIAVGQYAAALGEVDVAISDILSSLSPEGRQIVTNHDSLGYFAARYGLEVVGTVIPSGATVATPGSAHLAELVATIDRLGVPAIFTDATESSALAESVAADATSVSDREGFEVVVVDLFTGSLGESGSGAETLIDMLLLDAERIAEALS
jgi:zinc/manganese transport system substrate-binding protein